MNSSRLHVTLHPQHLHCPKVMMELIHFPIPVSWQVCGSDLGIQSILQTLQPLGEITVATKRFARSRFNDIEYGPKLSQFCERDVSG